MVSYDTFAKQKAYPPPTSEIRCVITERPVEVQQGRCLVAIKPFLGPTIELAWEQCDINHHKSTWWFIPLSKWVSSPQGTTRHPFRDRIFHKPSSDKGIPPLIWKPPFMRICMFLSVYVYIYTWYKPP